MAGKKRAHKSTEQKRGRREGSGAAETPRISGRWLGQAIALTVTGAAACMWIALCLLFWQGSWQLLYHPTTKIDGTPASAGVRFDTVSFAATDEGVNRLTGWWVAAEPDAAFGRFTVLYLHGQDGNLSDTVDTVAQLHAAGVNVLAIDYRGYGQSQFARPSEMHWREDAEWALTYLTETRHVAGGNLVLAGVGLGANLALEEAAAHPELAGAIVVRPLTAPTDAIFSDARAKLVPAHWLVRDRFDLDAAAARVNVPVLWFETPGAKSGEPAAYAQVHTRKMLVWMNGDRDFREALARWLGERQ